MDQNFNQEERELVKLVHYFKKRAERLMEEKKLSEEYQQLVETCDKFVEQLHLHAQSRSVILGEREKLKALVKDNARCPKCNGVDQLKLVGTDKNDKGWKSNKYKCRKCNIEFVWNAPNNPWDMIPYVENFISDLEKKLESHDMDEVLKLTNMQALEQMEGNLSKLKPIVEASEKDLAELEARETEMAAIVKQFKKQLQIEKIRMED
jgi:hypothetical protein